MEENKEKKTITLSLSTGISLIIIIMLSIVILAMVYFYNLSELKNRNATNENQMKPVEISTSSNVEKKSNENNNVENKSKESNNAENNIKEQEIPVEDLYGIEYGKIYEIVNDSAGKKEYPSFVKIVKEELYVLDGKRIDLKWDNAKGWDDQAGSKAFVKIDSDVKRVKSVNISQDYTTSFLVIKKDGTVMELLIGNNGGIYERYEKYEPMKDYKIEDILEYNKEKFTVKLKDGTTTTIDNPLSKPSGN